MASYHVNPETGEKKLIDRTKTVEESAAEEAKAEGKKAPKHNSEASK